MTTSPSNSSTSSIGTNWITGFKQEETIKSQPVPSSAYGYGAGGAEYGAYAPYHNSYMVPGSVSQHTVNQMNYPNTINYQAMSQINSYPNSQYYQGYGQYPGAWGYYGYGANNYSNVPVGSLGRSQRPAAGWGTGTTGNSMSPSGCPNQKLDPDPPGIETAIVKKEDSKWGQQSSNDSPFATAFRKISQEQNSFFDNTEFQHSDRNKHPTGFHGDRGQTTTGFGMQSTRGSRIDLDELPMLPEGYPRKDDNLIKVDKEMASTEWNFWNLPSKSKVLLVSNLPARVAKPIALFHLFGLYGDVIRTKIFQKKDTTGLVEFSSATFAMIARNKLDQYEIDNQKLYVTFSKFDRIKFAEEYGKINDENTLSFEGNEYNSRRRFRNEELTRINLKRSALTPKSTLVAYNFSPFKTGNDIKDIFVTSGFNVISILALRAKAEFIKERNQSKIASTKPGEKFKGFEDSLDDTKKLLVELMNESDAVAALALITGHPGAGENMLLNFSQQSVEEEKQHVESSSAFFYEIIPNNIPFTLESI